jgi:hypothetical protein
MFHLIFDKNQLKKEKIFVNFFDRSPNLGLKKEKLKGWEIFHIFFELKTSQTTFSPSFKKINDHQQSKKIIFSIFLELYS